MNKEWVCRDCKHNKKGENEVFDDHEYCAMGYCILCVWKKCTNCKDREV